MDVLSNGKKRAMETDSPPPISKQILSYIFSKLTTPPSTPSNELTRKEGVQSSKLSNPSTQEQLYCNNVENNNSHVDRADDIYCRSYIHSSDDVNLIDSTHKESLVAGEVDKVGSSSEEGRTDLEDYDGSSKSQGEKTSSSSNEQDVPSKYFRYLSIESDRGSHFLYGLVIPLVARILLVSCPNVMCIVEIPVIERKKQTSQSSSSDESIPSGNTSPGEGNAEFHRSSSNDSRGSTHIQSGESLQRDNSCSEKSSHRGSTLHGAFNCSFITDPFRRERAARLISSSVEALTAKVHVPHHDGSEFTLSRIQPSRHCYIRDEKSRTLCGAKVEYTNGSSCEVTVDDAFHVLAIRRPELDTPVLLFTFDCDSHEKKFQECLGYKNSFIIDIKSSEKPGLGNERFARTSKIAMCNKRLPRRLSSSKLLSNFTNEKDVTHRKEKSMSSVQHSQTLRRSRSSKLLSKSQGSRTGEKRERSPQVPCKAALNRADYSQKYAKLESETNAQAGSCKIHDTKYLSSGLLDTRFTEQVVSPLDITPPKREASNLSYGAFPQYSDQTSPYLGREHTETHDNVMVAYPYVLGFSNDMHSLHEMAMLPVQPNTASSGPVFSAPVASLHPSSLYSGGFDRSTYYTMPLVFHPTSFLRENNPLPGHGPQLNANQHMADVLSNGCHSFDWSSSSKSPVFSQQCGVEQGSKLTSLFSSTQQSFPLPETQMSYLDKVHKWYAHSEDLFSEKGTKQSPVFREMRSPTFSDTIVSSPKCTNASSDDDSSVRKVASEALAMLGESLRDETAHSQDEKI
ncbi:uncharacterized protein Gasu_15120 [Galdieria sulphuraria]|uniref:Uncharacterized protein n=1 Tax=Galdieria sulphuraria TaxID=130081 RepID=M2Y5N4_GALSU|nr:uncharacterized protein Gasu_15120 [Galdieria sulphuraria]EME31273.1 hypothetical protein Gasu_15120 [Galdieria sulphuraria]|eukprot:XP_005707793.1 hypothetical protein Gasu_15120 [Galdieria sulphuraria]